MLTKKYVKDYDETLFSDIDMSCLNFLDVLNKDQKHNLYSYLYMTFYDYELVYEKVRLQKSIEFKIWENADALNHLYETTQYEYNPIWNKDGTTTETRNLTGSNTNSVTDIGKKEGSHTKTITKSDSSTNNTSDTGDITTVKTGTSENAITGTNELEKTGTDTFKETGTDTTTHTGTDNVSTTANSDATVADYPMDSNDKKNRENTVSNSSGSNNETKNLTDTNTKDLSNVETIATKDTETKNIKDKRTDNLSDKETRNLSQENTTSYTGSETDTNVYSEDNNNTQNQNGSNTENETIERVEKGNIGLTSTQDLIKQEREIIIVMYGKIVALISDFFYLDMEVL